MFPVRSFSVTFLLCLGTTAPDLQIGSGIPLPHAEELERMIRTYIFPNKREGETFVEYFENHDMDVENDTLALLENLDFSVLDADGLRNILKIVKKREMENATISRRQLVGKWVEESPFYDYNAKHMYNKSIDLMKQSIYSTRYIIEKTKPIRAMYRTDLVYHMGVLYGYMLELRFKAENCLATMANFNIYYYKFARYLWLYERLLTIHVDFTNAQQRMFLIQAELDKPTTVVATTTESDEDNVDPDS